MLNISQNQLNKTVDIKNSKSGQRVFHGRYYKYFNRFLGAFAIVGIIILFLPWTQTITGRGNVTTLTPEQRPQTIQSPIPGRIEKWYVREGDFVSKGDTIIRISEIKSEYFDPNLVERTEQQRDAKAQSVGSYAEKVKALDRQINALINERSLKLEQAKNKLTQARLKVKSDSIDLEAANTNKSIAQRQYDRTVTLQEEGFKATKDVEDKRLKLQETEAKLISQENKLLASKNEVINAQVELSRLGAEYADKISKAQSDKFTAQSSQFDTEAQVSKLENEFSNYQIRNELRFIKAPYDGYINKALRGGIGQTFKEGEALVGIMPAQADLAVETYVAPIDLPLIHLGEKVRVQFDGWPAIVFSGWPNVSYGTYGAKVVAVENFISANGKFRVLLAPDEEDHKWPEEIRAGSGAYTMALLEDVPIWFELWRQLNGFPPNYYQPEASNSNSEKK
ncbi:HlyD family secretion protein [Winogradskyella poriferorum]|uniref:HlyD family secretion protein n=1 Tax=Winogradskyella poriferorum TaxID=307627 RepID=UPI000C516237|nr:biotin attachment protein [Flavobacteriaceae bacterium]|tara:strand:+ start:14279 stop:15631 length:1353 start_codon:yes stop_codon:yes gene_type:complete